MTVDIEFSFLKLEVYRKESSRTKVPQSRSCRDETIRKVQLEKYI